MPADHRLQALGLLDRAQDGPLQPLRPGGVMTVKDRLEYLREQIRAECISYGELAELQGLADQIEPGDVELLEWAGVPEHGEEDR